MTERTKKQISNRTLLYKLALVALMLFSLVVCNKEPVEKTISGTVTAQEGIVIFKYSRSSSSSPDSCTFTTDLPSPDNQFVLTIISGNTAEDKVIEGLEADRKVTWTAKTEGTPLNHGSGNFVHIITK